MDGLWWAPNWTSVGDEEFCARLVEVVAGEGWVLDGHYVDEGAAAIAWRAADTIIWLDLPRRVAVRRAVTRSVRRVTGRTLLWGTNRQQLSTLSLRSMASLVRRCRRTRLASSVHSRMTILSTGQLFVCGHELK